ncbi:MULTISPECIES: hypothetical protein [unclassified Chelatococcus]|uniref:hypothetical protein n=1 Tax=Chelatococcus sp. HY11 TaxID=2835634 RepID=UPI0020BF217B|nr:MULTISPECIES: hypothetical protein [unclassified Chelatococcus]
MSGQFYRGPDDPIARHKTERRLRHPELGTVSGDHNVAGEPQFAATPQEPVR